MQLQNCICKMAHSVVQNDIKTFYKVRKNVHVLSDIIVGHEKYKLNYQKKNYQKNVILVSSSQMLDMSATFWHYLLKKRFLTFFPVIFFISTFLFLIMRKKRLWTVKLSELHPSQEQSLWSGAEHLWCHISPPLTAVNVWAPVFKPET